MTAPTVALPPAGPALTLHEAAAKLRRLAEAALAELASNSYWGAGWHAGITDALGGPGGDLAAVMGPRFALDLADALDDVAVEAVKHAAGGFGNCQSEVTDGWPMTVARRILEAS